MGVVNEALSQDIELSMGRHDRGVLDGLIRKWRSADAAGRESMELEFREFLAAEDVKRRSAAVLFFERLPANDAGRLLAEVQAHPERFEHEPDPWFGTGELRALVAVALSKRLNTEAERSWVREQALRPYVGHRLVPGLLDGDRDWALAHASEVIEATPEALAVYVTSVDDADLSGVAKAARATLREDVFLGVLDNLVSDPKRRAAARDA